MKYCPYCGKELKEQVTFCPECGSNLEEKEPKRKAPIHPILEKKDIAMQIIFSFITCGIYGLIWFVQMTDDTNTLSDDNNPTSGGLALLYTILTCGIYSLYWNYKMGQRLYQIGKKYNKEINDNSVLYLLLSIFGLSIVSECLIQSDLNRFAE